MHFTPPWRLEVAELPGSPSSLFLPTPVPVGDALARPRQLLRGTPWRWCLEPAAVGPRGGTTWVICPSRGGLQKVSAPPITQLIFQICCFRLVRFSFTLFSSGDRRNQQECRRGGGSGVGGGGHHEGTLTCLRRSNKLLEDVLLPFHHFIGAFAASESGIKAAASHVREAC